MRHEPQPFANLAGILVVKTHVGGVNPGDSGVAQLAQDQFEIDDLERRGTHEIVRHIHCGQRRIRTASKTTITRLDNALHN
jgi:hypothetical protein